MPKHKSLDHMVSDWINHWNNGSMAKFQVNHPHGKLEEHYDKYILGRKKAKIFVPLCGTMFDMYCLADKGHEIVGIECSDLAIKTFFSKHKLHYHQEHCDDVKGTLYKSDDGKIKIYCCDLFDFKLHLEGKFDVILDFGSMGAIQKEDLQPYADMMKRLMGDNCRHILECFVYDTNKYSDCHPNCFSLNDLQALFGDCCSVEKMDEGPNPYEDEFLTSEETNYQDNSFQQVYPQITGTAYFLIKPKV
ncbi:probable thiopurine S-methyltransferase [Biomphalaria glabrata]|uniref:thiopurine S-methyltransferase n=1 Tax=Biomphalaria glabrata TaxID=6526 RepID=A0A9W2ZSZ0_BIOGL|nr:probable thiopurine S-methyltransferase [Biomphalaria glabrata]XP_055878167.1 probable thiopurine S-methyltransferase [Biomphalaria glabrata]KAI8793355.1 thiopurine S-methyltransferase [Biomphalaria glabrata]